MVYDWEGNTEYIRYDGNECDADEHPNQSPIILQEDNQCEDEHRMRGRAIAECDWDDINFSVNQHSLQAEFIGCQLQPVIDFSHLPSYFALANMQVKVPSEHCRYINGEVECYDGEIVFAHYGSKSEKGDLRHEMLNIAGFIKATQQPNKDYEEVLKKWETFQQRQYKTCQRNNSTGWADMGVTWGEDLCVTKLKIEYAMDSWRQRHLRQMNEKYTLRGNAPSLQDDAEIFETVPPVSWFVDYIDKDDEFGNILDERKEEGNGNHMFGSEGLLPSEESRNRMLPEDKLRMYSKLLPDVHFYYRYFGTMTTPPCMNEVNWRILREPYHISYEQLHRTEYLIAAHVNEECNLATVGRPRDDGSCKVDVNRALQRLQSEHELSDCDHWNGEKWGN